MATPYRSELCSALDLTYATSNGTPTRAPVLPANDVIEEDGVKIPADAQVTNPGASPPATQNTHSCMVAAPCERIDEITSNICGDGISCHNVPEHFKCFHGIRRMKKTERIRCLWEGCDTCVVRKNFVRHVREHHLGHPRVKNSKS